ncbi:MAG: hypothetical protein QOD99_1083 [Chthoniobacter sp.]|nr:hypothetical protein [Chthoniobacter sp.]
MNPLIPAWNKSAHTETLLRSSTAQFPSGKASVHLLELFVRPIAAGVLCILIGTLSASTYGQGFYLQVPQPPKIPNATFKVTSYGGVGDGRTMNTEAFRKAIEACTKAGGGNVIVTSGTFVSGPIKLASKMALVVEKDAVILASSKFSDFGLPDPLPTNQAELTRLKAEEQQLISGSKLTDVAIRGEGKIDGSGAYWWAKSDIASQRGLKGIPTIPGASPEEKPSPAPSPETQSTPLDQTASSDPSKKDVPVVPTPQLTKPLYVPRPHLIMLKDCERVQIQGVTLLNSPMFHLVPSRCREVLIEDVKIITPSNAPNTDGIDPGNCDKVLIRRCYIDTGDDNIALKGGGSGGAPPMQNITITDCKFGHGHGVSIGSETNAGVRNLLVQKCTFENTDNALRIKSDRNRGGLVENVLYRDITMKNVGFPITIFLFYDDKKTALTPELKPVSPTTPKVRNVHFLNITCEGASRKAIELAGLPESPITDVQLENIRVAGAEVPMSVQDTRNLQMKNVEISTPSTSATADTNVQPKPSVAGSPAGKPSKVMSEE